MMRAPHGWAVAVRTPEGVIERIQRHIDLGCTFFVIEFFGRDTKPPAQLFAEKVMPAFAS